MTPRRLCPLCPHWGEGRHEDCLCWSYQSRLSGAWRYRIVADRARKRVERREETAMSLTYGTAERDQANVLTAQGWALYADLVLEYSLRRRV